ncbi:MAG: hypothetical protein A2X09_01185 [Bacteroidetes bacterium GWF2_43_11]|nr:MAG: hypothetical protein A2X09_01185 [Bacteroidetes bacterium GWF2_43_11]
MIIAVINMPVMARLKMTAGIKITSFIPILVTAAYEFKNFLHKAIRAGFNQYPIKPIQKKSLILAHTEMGRIDMFKKNRARRHEFVELLYGTEKKIFLLASIKTVRKINSDFLGFFGFSSKKDFYSPYETFLEFSIKNGNKTFRYNSTKDIHCIDSFMKMNGVEQFYEVERNCILNKSVISTMSDFSLNIKLIAQNPIIALILQPLTF